MTDTNGVAADHLRSFVSRIENLEAEKKTVSEDIASVYDEAGSSGFDKKILRKLIARRKKDADALAEEDAILSLYLDALQPSFDFQEAAQ